MPSAVAHISLLSPKCIWITTFSYLIYIFMGIKKPRVTAVLYCAFVPLNYLVRIDKHWIKICSMIFFFRLLIVIRLHLKWSSTSCSLVWPKVSKLPFKLVVINWQRKVLLCVCYWDHLAGQLGVMRCVTAGPSSRWVPRGKHYDKCIPYTGYKHL